MIVEAVSCVEAGVVGCEGAGSFVCVGVVVVGAGCVGVCSGSGCGSGVVVVVGCVGVVGVVVVVGAGAGVSLLGSVTTRFCERDKSA